MRYTIRIMNTTTKKIVLICGNPDSDTFTGAILDHYHAAAEENGHEVKRYNLGDMDFDPILHMGYKQIQQLEKTLTQIKNKLTSNKMVVSNILLCITEQNRGTHAAL